MKTPLPADKIVENLMELQKFYWDNFKGQKVEPFILNLNEAIYRDKPTYK